MATNIGSITNEQLVKNVRKLLEMIVSGEVTRDELVERRMIEIRHLLKMNKTAGNDRRIDYIRKEIDMLLIYKEKENG